jgi:hypothetical protein
MTGAAKKRRDSLSDATRRQLLTCLCRATKILVQSNESNISKAADCNQTSQRLAAIDRCQIKKFNLQFYKKKTKKNIER